MEKAKRILAMAGVIVIILMYLIVFYLAITANSNTQRTLIAAIVCTIVVPCLIYGMQLAARILGERKSRPEDRSTLKEKKK